MTVLVPTGKIAGALLVTVTAPQLSATVGVPRATFVAPHIPGEATTVTKAGQEIVGGWLSVTITSCGQVAVLMGGAPWGESVEMAVAGESVRAMLVTVTAPQLSATVGAPSATLGAPHIPSEAKTG